MSEVCNDSISACVNSSLVCVPPVMSVCAYGIVLPVTVGQMTTTSSVPDAQTRAIRLTIYRAERIVPFELSPRCCRFHSVVWWVKWNRVHRLTNWTGLPACLYSRNYTTKMICSYLWSKVSPLQVRGVQEVKAPRFHDTRHPKVVRSSPLRTGRLYPQEYPGTHF